MTSDATPTVSARKKKVMADPATPPPTPLPESMGDWLGALTLLENIPFVYLVPNSQMLPSEALRFFYLDRNWLDTLVDGAFSVGQYSTRDALQYQQAAPAIRLQAARHAARSPRAAPATQTPAAAVDPDGVMSGFLLRSSVVAAYPGMQVNAYSDPQGQNLLPLLRLDALGADVMIGIWAGVPVRVDFDEPPHGLHFGAVPQDGGGWKVALRWLVEATTNGTSHNPGQEIEIPNGQGGADPAWVPAPWRDPNLRVLDVATLASALQTQLAGYGALADDTLTPRGFAIQMVAGPESQTFGNLAP